MVNVWLIAGITASILIVGGGIGYLIWALTRPKKMMWKAKVYQLGDGVKPPIRNDKGEILSNVKLSDLRPFTKDIVERVEKKPGITIFRLQKMDKVVPAVTSDCVDYWGDKDKQVAVLLEGDTCTLLKKGYNKRAGMIFHPMPHDRVSMIKGEMIIRKERIKEKKDILQAILPYIAIAITMLSLVAITYFFIQGFIEVSENLKEGQAISAQAMSDATEVWAKVMSGNFSIEDVGITKEAPPVIPG